MNMNINGRHVGKNHLPLVIAEVAQAHDGSLGMAHAFIDAAADAGAHAIKFQTHIAAAESTAREPWRIKFSEQDDSRYDYWRRMEFTEKQWQGLKEHADKSGLLFFSSPFSIEAVDLLMRVGVPAWKAASGELENEPLLDAMIFTGLPMLISTGMSSWNTIDRVVKRCQAAHASFGLLQCTTEYPCRAGNIGLNVVQELQSKYGCPAGLSDHSGDIFAGLAAVALGASILEVHVTFDRAMFGPDVPASLDFKQLKQLVDGAMQIHEMISNPVNKDEWAAKASSLRGIFGRSIVARDSLAVGTVLLAQHLAFKKPGTGLPPSAISRVVGRRLLRPLVKDEEIKEADLALR